jgi:acetate kinase
MRILVVNAGSSSVKLRLLDADDSILAATDLPSMASSGTADRMQSFVHEAGEIDAIGHRVVHGGSEFRESLALTDEIIARLQLVSDLAPLHNPPALSALEAIRRLLPDHLNVACFDTAFHATIPERAATYAIPRAWIARGVRRFGFHGLSHAYAARRSAELLGRASSKLRIVTCHLGAGASLAAVAYGRSVDTTMGFTPLEGLVMATRSGSVDPGGLLWLQRSLPVSPAEMERMLEKESGLLALAGNSDMRQVLQDAAVGDERARLAVEIYIHHLRRSIGSMAASMMGLDAIAFTGGVGEGSAQIRAAACEGLGFLGVSLDAARNEAENPVDRDLSGSGAIVMVTLIHAREELEIAREVRRVAASVDG